MAALFHDTGMAFTDNGSTPSRADHHYFSTKILDLYIDDKFTILPFKDRLKPIISFVCFSHGLTIPELYSHSLFNITDRIEFDEVRYSLLSVLLRIGDLLDIEECRSNAFILDHFKSMYSEESINHCIRNKRIQLYNYSIKGVSIEVLADNVEQYKIWYTWFKYLEDEVLYFNTHLQNYSVCLPAPKTSIKKTSGMNFEIEEYRFEIDESGGIWDVLSQSIYTDEFDFIREIIQNAIDATLYLAFTKIQDEIKRYSPRIWHASCTIDDIWVGFSSQNKTLIIKDSGIGMDKNDLKRFLFKVSGSGYSSSDRKDLGFPGIAKFGIGFVSCLANADNIEIFTRKRSDSSTYHVSMSKNMSFAIVEKENIDNFLGTIISIKTKHSYEYRKVEAYIKDTFLFPSTGIDIINLDNVERTLSEIGIKAELVNYYLKPYSFQQLIADNSIGINQLFKGVESQKQELLKTRDMIDQLENILQDVDHNTDKNEKIIENSTDTKTLRSILERVHRNFRNLQIGIDFPIDYSSFNVECTSEYLDSLYYIRPILQEKLNIIEESMSKFAFRTQTRKCTPVSFGFKWKYCVVYLYDDLQVAKIKYSEDPIKLDNGKGIVFMRHENINSDLGYEYDALIGFLFYNGLVHSALNFFTSESVTSISHRRYSTRFVMPGLIEDITDLEEEVFTDTDDNPNASIDSHSFDQNYSSIFIKNNSIRYSDGFLLSDLGLNYYNGKDYDLSVLVNAYLTKHIEENNDIETVLLLDKYTFRQ
ncbi:MAG TPA: ATP-binding protein, partial [Candidatus Cloacimonadota bacterium]|nr:ATP-binding protein [Candidatus Cloacimonadota bacterium]